ncbi:hypothetical protein [Photorhabdus heterorhabditis]|uniref:Uncharacterized protein n=1 Tax=Photorhabdus heterorhabditis TaxID=880156 RepID=A0A5B0X307_9GAMM|nr:hypothetical protein [Photorhabdus heterorhabditis]KAA1193740.1 hypothetical protein F0L16_06850 [Photorhabdus heterorhabditis]KOY60889.1 hypothetical protein AM629_16730 [Photorhabdus heterorhabditis]MBS9441948.1 hypothetical protein [Photorhabdus heterorhabditis]
MRGLGYFLLSIGIIWILVAFNMDISVSSQYGGKINNDLLIASQQNHILIGAFIILYGLIIIIFSRIKRLLELICKKYNKDVSELISKKTLTQVPMQNSDNLKRANNYRHYDFIDRNANILEKRVAEFCKLCSFYIKEVKHNGGDEKAARFKVMLIIDTISLHLTKKLSKEFKKLCELYISS